jgi:hypothetical protein
MNAIGLALKNAGFGYETAEDRKFKLAAEAWAKHPGPNAGLARKSHIMNALGGEITWSLVQDYDKHTLGLAVTHLLSHTEPKKSDTGVKSVGGGQCKGDTHIVTAPATQSQDNARSQALRRSEPARQGATPKTGTPAAPPPFGQYLQGTEESRAREKIVAAEKLKVLADKQAARNASTVAVMKRLCKLDTVMVNGKPIGDCMVAEVKAWAETRLSDMRAAGRDARFAMILVANLESNKVIRDHWRDPNEVDAQYAKAEAGYAA